MAKSLRTRRRLRWALVLLLVVGLLAAGGLWRQRGKAATPPPVVTAPQGLDLLPSDVVTAAPRPLTRTLAVSGGLKAVNSAQVKAKVAVELQRLTVREGDAVAAGQVIGQLDPTEARARLKQAQESAASARAQLDIAQRTLANNQALVDQGFISRNALDTSVSNAAAARASLLSAQAAIDLAQKALDDTVLRSPISGTVSQRLAQPGERVALDARIVEVVDLSRLEIEAAVPADEVAGVQVGQSATLQVDGLAEPVSARVARINPSTQAGTRAVMVYLALDGRPGLRQGLFARGQIALGEQSALVVPVAAVRVEQARPYVLQLQQDKVVQHTVSLGARGQAHIDGRLEEVVELREGVAAGAVLLRGTVGQVREGTAARLLPSAAAPGPAASAVATPAATAASR